MRSQRKAVDTSLCVVRFLVEIPVWVSALYLRASTVVLTGSGVVTAMVTLFGSSALSTTGLVRAVFVCIRDCRCHRFCCGASDGGFLCIGVVVIVVVCWSPGCGVFAVVILVARFLFGLLCFFSSPYPAYPFPSSRSHIISCSVQAPDVYCREQSTCNYSSHLLRSTQGAGGRSTCCHLVQCYFIV